MTPYKKRMNPFIARMAEDMEVRNFSTNTIDAYTYHVDKFCQYFGKPADELGPEEIRQFQLHLVQEKKVSWSSFNQAVCGLRFLYQVTLGKDWTIKHIPFGKRPKKLPTVLSDEEACRLLDCIKYPKHRTALLTCYAAGLRLSEATHLRVSDIDGQRNQLHIRSGKGRKARVVPASPRLLDALREYWKLDRPADYLFPGRARAGTADSASTAPSTTSPPLRVIDLLRRFAAKFMQWDRPAAQVKNVLSKILLCRTATLKGHLYRCSGCDSEVNVYNSCGDRHCPQCGGARRADWMDKSAEVVLPGVNYFQVVFTVPAQLSSLMLGHRRELYNLLFQSAWQALATQLRRTGQYRPAALMVLHTWNQQLEHHPHLHALVPGGGPSLDDQSWNTARHPRHSRRRKPYLTDNVALGQAFREQFIRGLKRLIRQGKLTFGGRVDFLSDARQRAAWLADLESIDWNVFIEGPPHSQSDPRQVVKYLAGYLTGGPLSDHRLIDANEDEVHFWARPKKSSHRKRGMHSPRPYRLSGRQFLQRWSLHILPKQFTRSRCYGGYHGGQRAAYLQRCRQLLRLDPEPPEEALIDDPAEESSPACPNCGEALILIASASRPSWRSIFETSIYRSDVYSPQLHITVGISPSSRAPPCLDPQVP